MFKEWKYRQRTRAFFNPAENIDVSKDQFMQILRGEVVNPLKLKDISADDYAYMVVGVSPGSPLNSWAGQEWGPYNYENAFEFADWYGRFFVEGDSHLVVPGTRRIFDFYLLSMNSRKCSSRDFSLLANLPGLDMDISRDMGNRILVSDLKIDEIHCCIRDVFRR